MYLNVWIYRMGDMPPHVLVKVQTNGSTIKVLSWSTQR
jgi:hypothetical protein